MAAGLAAAGAIVTTVANFGFAILVAGLGAAPAGIFFAATAIVAILGNSAGLGTMTGLVYFMPEVLDPSSPNPRSLLRLALAPVLVISGLAAAVLALAADPLAGLVAAERADDVGSMLVRLAPIIPAWALTNTLLGATRGLGSMTPTVAINQVFKPLVQLLAIGGLLLLADDPSTGALALAWGLPIVASAGLAAVAVARLGGLRGAGPGPVPAGRFWAYTRPRALSTSFQIALERIDVILVSALAGESAAGIYGTITRFVTAGNFGLFAVAQSSGPTIRRALAAGRRAEATVALRRVTGWMVLAGWPYFLFVAVEATDVIAVIEPTFTAGADALAVAAVAMLASALAGPIDLTLLMLGRSRASLAAVAAALAVDVALTVLLVPRYGLVGAALAWGVAVLVQNGTATVIVAADGLRAPGRAAVVAAVGATLAVVPLGLATPVGFAWSLLTGLGAGVLLVGWVVANAATLLDRGQARAGREPTVARTS